MFIKLALKVKQAKLATLLDIDSVEDQLDIAIHTREMEEHDLGRALHVNETIELRVLTKQEIDKHRQEMYNRLHFGV